MVRDIDGEGYGDVHRWEIRPGRFSETRLSLTFCVL